MKTFFSTISIQTNPVSLEKVVVALLAVTESHVFFHYSKNKLNLLDKLAPSKIGIGGLAKKSLQLIKNTVNETNKTLQKTQTTIVFEKSIFSKEYFSYLNKYNNGILNFSEPALIPFDFTTEKFESYYLNFIGEPTELVEKKTLSFAQKIKPAFDKKGLVEKADLKFYFDPLHFHGIFKETDISLITKNGDISAIQTIDFNLTEQTIVNNVFETQSIQVALQHFAKDTGTKVKPIQIVFEEPLKDSENHVLFDITYKNLKDNFNFITPDVLEKETEKIANSNNIKFSDYLQTLEI
ncbi:hypothetical protein [Flavobacterium ammonificans]|uniref:DUF3037 domain-containing protein n=1 Tax=Flavobacterium ammonificans TaxID=1751056 RepID=A0ABM7UZQ8_9FLAO|nr:hypothetical protein [Flavobacterium ammonificans]BDB53072.1 hypothetical protein GENT11_13840 [Flavobacterium ammonificans]